MKDESKYEQSDIKFEIPSRGIGDMKPKKRAEKRPNRWAVDLFFER